MGRKGVVEKEDREGEERREERGEDRGKERREGRVGGEGGRSREETKRTIREWFSGFPFTRNKESIEK